VTLCILIKTTGNHEVDIASWFIPQSVTSLYLYLNWCLLWQISLLFTTTTTTTTSAGGLVCHSERDNSNWPSLSTLMLFRWYSPNTGGSVRWIGSFAAIAEATSRDEEEEEAPTVAWLLVVVVPVPSVPVKLWLKQVVWDWSTNVANRVSSDWRELTTWNRLWRFEGRIVPEMTSCWIVSRFEVPIERCWIWCQRLQDGFQPTFYQAFDLSIRPDVSSSKGWVQETNWS